LPTELFCEQLDEKQVAQIPILSLAHVGDGVYELLARSYAVKQGGGRPTDLHRRTVSLVSAASQCRAASRLLPELTGEEKSVFLRGRNAKPKSVPKHASGSEYAYSSGWEAVFGMLFLTGRRERIMQLWERVLAVYQEGQTEGGL